MVNLTRQTEVVRVNDENEKPEQVAELVMPPHPATRRCLSDPSWTLVDEDWHLENGLLFLCRTENLRDTTAMYPATPSMRAKKQCTDWSKISSGSRREDTRQHHHNVSRMENLWMCTDLIFEY